VKGGVIDEPDWPYYKRTGSLSGKLHGGMDFSISAETDVKSVFYGKVLFTSTGANKATDVKYGNWSGRYGTCIIIESFITGEKCQVLYAHLNSISVNKGQTVNSGTSIGKSGNTGNSAGPHLHFEARRSPYKFELKSFVDMRNMFSKY